MKNKKETIEKRIEQIKHEDYDELEVYELEELRKDVLKRLEDN